jgi:acetylglutamate kinase
VPVVSPLGRFAADGEGCNVNGDDAAAAIAVALGADELVLIADIPAVLDASGRRVPSLDLESLAVIVGDGVARGGMIAKLDAARRAVVGGVSRVRIGDLSAIDDLSAGTLVSSSPSTVAV